jgi:signal transduction histidine kinase
LGFGTFLTLSNAASGSPKSVLLLVTGQSGILEVDEAVAGVRTILQSQSLSPLTLYTEYLDQDRFGSEYLERLPYWYLEKYRSHKPDVIVAGGGGLDFLLQSRLHLWPRVPIVFSLVDERILSRAPLGEQITGIVFSGDVQKLLAGALRLLPDTERVAFVSGSTPQDRYWRNRYRQEVDQSGKKIAFLDLMGLPMRDLRNRLAHLPRNTIVFYSPMYVDGAGRSFLPSEVLSLPAASSKCPIFGMDEALLGYGIVGGRLVCYWEMGRQVARLVLRILQGESASDIPIQTSSASVVAFDWRQFRQASPWERYRWLILATIAFCIIQTSLITGLLYQRWHRKRATASLDERLQFETLVADTSAILSNLPVSDVDGHIRDCLGRIARFLKVDRGSLWRWTADGRFVATHSWWSEGVDPPPLSVPADSSAGLKGALQRGAIVVSRLDDLPGDANRAGIGRFGARSLAVAPLSVGGKSIGALVFVTTKSECSWPEGLAQRLKTLGDIFAVALARKESEISVRQSEELCSAVLASLEENVTVLDREGFILRTSPISALKVSDSGCGPLVQTPAVGRNYLKLWRLVSGDVNSDPIPMVEAVKRVLQGRERVAVVEYQDPAVPEGRWFEVRIHRLERSEGGAVVTHLDISNRKRAEIEVRRNLDEIAHLNRVAAMGELTASVAHEINQPLTAILSNAQAACRLLNSRSPDLAEVRECLADIIADDKRAGEVIKQLRALLKKGEFQASEVDLNEVVRDVIRLVGHDALLRKASVVFEPLPGIPPVLGDRIQLYQVALNLIVNGLAAAAEQSPHDRWLLVRTGESKVGGVELTVEDSGNGIAESDLPRVFEPFFTTKQEGLGMGLSISRSIIQAHGGHLSAENSAGGGAIFRCVLPAAPQAAMVSAS